MTDAASACGAVELLVDPGTFAPWDEEVVSDDPLGFVDTRPYTERLAAARERAGTTEAVVSGRATVDGHDVVVIAGEFGFLAGTMGQATAERVVRALERAVERRVPVIGLPVSGGTRMQEGTVAFLQMANAAAAAQRLRAAGLPFLVWLRSPTTGGVLASWASLAQVTFAEPGALIGLTGPRVVRLLTGTPMPPGVQTAENLHVRGLVDLIVPAADLRERVAAFLRAVRSPADPWDPGAPPLELPEDAAVDPWRAVHRSRRVDRPGIRHLLEVCATDVTELRGDGAGGEDPGCVTLLARVCGVGLVIVGHDRRPGHRGAQLGAVGYRKARRAMRLAGELGLPLVTVIDTEGAQTSPQAEEGGLAHEIAHCLATLSALPVPTLAVLLGEGAGGGALALLPADRVVAAEHAWLAPIAPEGASAILHRTTERAPELARAQAIGSTDLRRLGIVDVVVADRPAPGEEGAWFGRRVAATAAVELGRLLALDDGERLAARAARYRRTDRR